MNNDRNNNQFLFDSRIAQRNIRDGRVEREAYEKHIASLPDLIDQCDDIGEEIYGQKKHGLTLSGEFISNQDEE
jgi:hypothetical protein